MKLVPADAGTLAPDQGALMAELMGRANGICGGKGGSGGRAALRGDGITDQQRRGGVAVHVEGQRPLDVIAGEETAMAEVGAPIGEGWVQQGEFSFESGLASADALLASYRRAAAATGVPWQVLAAVSAATLLWGLYFALGFWAFSRGLQANGLGSLLARDTSPVSRTYRPCPSRRPQAYSKFGSLGPRQPENWYGQRQTEAYRLW